MTAALVWPMVGLAALILLRKPLSSLLTRQGLKRLKAGPVELEWVEEVLEDARDNLAETTRDRGSFGASAIDQGSTLDAAAYREEMASLAAVDPAAAVLISFTRLERMLRQHLDLTETEGYQRRYTTRALGDLAAERGLWSDRELAAYKDLIPIRNLAAHGDVLNIDESSSYEFAELALQLMIALLLAGGQTIAPRE